jgi:chromosome segregation ATPase
MPEGTPLILQILLVVFLAIVGREGGGYFWKHYLAKPKTNAEIDGLHLSNANNRLHGLQEAIEAIENLREKYERAVETINELKEDKKVDAAEKARKDGVIAEQRLIIKELYEDIAKLRVKEERSQGRITELETRVTHLDTQLDEMNRKNLQLQGMVKE